MKKSALISDDGVYRYQLVREWDITLPISVWIMLNPSKADAETDDPTIRKCISFAQEWDCGSVVVVNLFAFRATEPAEMKKARFPVGNDNDRHIVHAVTCNPDAITVAAWGAHGSHLSRDWDVRKMLFDSGARQLSCLGRTKEGKPLHPLYVPLSASLVPFEL